MTPDNNGNRTTNEWLRHIDEQQRREFSRIHDKLDGKSDKEDCEKVESRTRNIELKQAGISAAIATAAVWVKSQFFS